MKKTKTPTRSKSARHNDSANFDKNTLRKFLVRFTYRQTGIRVIEAKSQANAEEKANFLPIMQEGFWHDWPESYDILKVSPFQENEAPKNIVFVEIPDPDKLGQV